MVAGPAARPARRRRLAVHVRVGLRRLARPARRARARASTRDGGRGFVARHPYWIGDWAAFAGAGALADQVRFEREWSALRAYARERGVRLIGDVPIYVAAGQRRPPRASRALPRAAPSPACRPTTCRATGQLWGNPLYDWRAHARDGYRWWIERFRRTFELVDVTRIDHFRGFVAYWAVPARHETRGRRAAGAAGPARDALRRALERELGELPVIAEDLGVITPAVVRAARRARLPGNGRAPVRVRRRADATRTGSRTTREHSVVYTRRTTTTPRAAGGSRCDARARATGSIRASRTGA